MPPTPTAGVTTTAAGLTPHDGFVVAFLIPPVPTTASVTPTTINFGDVNVGASASQTITFTNTTTFVATVTVATIAISGTNAADYTQTSNCTSVTQGQSCTITVTFAPSAVGSRTATLTITNDSTSDPSLTVSLIGNGTPTTATLTPTTATFPSTDIGATSAAQVFTFTNTSVSVAETVGTPTVSGDYVITTNTCTASIAVGATCTVSVAFKPIAAGSRTGTLTVPNSSLANPSLTAALGGTGLDTTATLTPATYAFPDTGIGATSAASTFTVTNTSAIAITINAPTIAGDYAIAATTCGGSLAASATCTVTVTFTPTAVGARTGTLTVTDSSTANPTLTAALTGNGLPTTATLTPATATFPSTDVTGTSATQTFTVTNTSPNSLSIKAVAAATTGDFTITATTCTNATLAASATCTVTVAFTPTVVGARTGTLTVTDTSSANPTLTATLSGTALPTTATLTPASADFGSIYAGGGLSTARIFTVTNTSAVAIKISSVTLTGNFTETTTCGTSLAAGATCTVSVIFAPLTAGALTGTLTVANTSTANPILTATLTGTGLPSTATLTPASANFGNVIVGQTSAGQGFVWTNTSAIPLTIASVSTTGVFAVAANTCTGTVAAGGFCLITVTFKPIALGIVTGSVTVASSASANPTLSSALAGRGVADVQADVSSLNFGNVDLGFTSPSQTFNITNYTAAAIALTGITINGDYAYTTTCGSILGSLGNCTITVSFTPTALGTRAGTITVTTNDTKVPVITVALTGNGVDFAIAVSPASGATLAGYNITPSLTLTPLGGFSSPIAIGCTTDAAGSTCLPQSTPYTLAALTAMPLAITTTSKYTVIGYGGLGGTGSSPWVWLVALGASLAMFTQRRRRLLPRLLALLITLALLGTAGLGCGSRDPNLNNNPTLPGTYTYTVSATDGEITHTATYSLTISVRY